MIDLYIFVGIKQFKVLLRHSLEICKNTPHIELCLDKHYLSTNNSNYTVEIINTTPEIKQDIIKIPRDHAIILANKLRTYPNPRTIIGIKWQISTKSKLAIFYLLIKRLDSSTKQIRNENLSVVDTIHCLNNQNEETMIIISNN